MLKYAPWTLSRGYNIEEGQEVEMWKLEIEKLTRSTKQILFGSVSTAFVQDCSLQWRLMPGNIIEKRWLSAFTSVES